MIFWGCVGERGALRWRWLLACRTGRLQLGFTVSPNRRCAVVTPPTSEVCAEGRCRQKPIRNLCNSRNSQLPDHSSRWNSRPNPAARRGVSGIRFSSACSCENPRLRRAESAQSVLRRFLPREATWDCPWHVHGSVTVRLLERRIVPRAIVALPSEMNKAY